MDKNEGLTEYQREILNIMIENPAGIKNDKIVEEIRNKKPHLSKQSVRSMISVATGRLCKRGLVTKHPSRWGKDIVVNPVMEKIKQDFPGLLEEAKTGKRR